MSEINPAHCEGWRGVDGLCPTGHQLYDRYLELARYSNNLTLAVEAGERFHQHLLSCQNAAASNAPAATTFVLPKPTLSRQAAWMQFLRFLVQSGRLSEWEGVGDGR